MKNDLKEEIERPKICTIFFFEDVAFREVELLMLSWWYLALLLQGIDQCSETFFFNSSSSFGYVRS
jgi:hypothetical protein